jgi:hypothetical protein
MEPAKPAKREGESLGKPARFFNNSGIRTVGIILIINKRKRETKKKEKER